MNGSNHLQESDSRPLELCVVCLRKLQSNIKFDILERYKNFMSLFRKKEITVVRISKDFCKLLLEILRENSNFDDFMPILR